jgi:hypothetical protein
VVVDKIGVETVVEMVGDIFVAADNADDGGPLVDEGWLETTMEEEELEAVKEAVEVVEGCNVDSLSNISGLVN